MCALVGAVLSMSANVTLLRLGGGEFVLFIMLYYVLLYWVQRYFVNHLGKVVSIVALLSLAVYIYWFPYKYETSSKGLYGISTLYRWIPYFGFMLLGAWVGIKSKMSKHNVVFKWYDCLYFLISLIIFYGIQFMAKKNLDVAPYQIVTLIPLAGIVFFFYKICNADVFRRIYTTRRGGLIIMTVSGLCLESYLIQHYMFTDKFNAIFPFNIPLIMLLILIMSYICRCLARIFSQTFRTENYEWKKIFAI